MKGEIIKFDQEDNMLTVRFPIQKHLNPFVICRYVGGIIATAANNAVGSHQSGKRMYIS